jgi:hypothetical protein
MGEAINSMILDGIEWQERMHVTNPNESMKIYRAGPNLIGLRLN